MDCCTRVCHQLPSTAVGHSSSVRVRVRVRVSARVVIVHIVHICIVVSVPLATRVLGRFRLPHTIATVRSKSTAVLGRSLRGKVEPSVAMLVS